MTLRDLWLMAHGRRRESRIHAFEQARLVWSGSEAMDLRAYIERGELPGDARPLALDPELQKNVDAKVGEIMRTGKLIMG